MAIEKNNVKVSSRFDSDDESMSSYNDSDDFDQEDDDVDDDDSGAGSDDFNLLELSETGTEFCQVGNVTCSIPFQLYQLSNLQDILTIDVWNDCLTEEDRLSLSCYLPDIDQLTFMRTLKELFQGCNFHFGSPINRLFDMLKGGQCEPKNALYLQGRNLFSRSKHYHSLRNYHNDQVVNLCQTRDAWETCKGYSIDEKLRVLNIVKSQKTLMREKKEDIEEGCSSDKEDEEEEEAVDDEPWRTKVNDRRKLAQNKLPRPHSGYGIVGSGLELPSQRHLMSVEHNRYSKPKSSLKTVKLQSAYNGYGRDDNIDDDDEEEDPLFGMRSRRHGKKYKFSGDIEQFMAPPPYSSRQSHNNNFARSSKYANPRAFSDHRMKPVKGSLADLRGDGLYRHGDGFSNDSRYIVSDDLNGKSKKIKSVTGRDSPDTSLRSCYRASMQQMNERFLNSDFGQEKIRVNVVPPKVRSGRDSRRFMQNDDDNTESDSSKDGYDEEEEEEEITRLMRRRSSVSSGGLTNSRLPILKSGNKFSMRDMREIEMRGGRGAYLQHLGQDIYPSGTVRHSFNAKGKMRPLSRDYEDEFKDRNNRKELFRGNKYSQRSNLSGRKRGFSEDVNNDNAWGGRLGNSADENLESSLLITRKKRKAREDNNGEIQQPVSVDDDIIISKSKGKKKMDVDDVRFIDLETSETTKASEAEVETTKPPQKKPFVLITPTVQTGFSFSIVHLLSAVRMALVSPRPEDPLDVNKPPIIAMENAEHNKDGDTNGVPNPIDDSIKSAQQGGSQNLPSITIQEIVSCVKSNPGDPCILEAQEPLQDLIRGVLKIFSSKTSPLGAKGWKPLVTFEKSTKSWFWIGGQSVQQEEAVVKEVTSPEAWGIPHKMLVKLVDQFANWLKNSQETLQQIGSLPEPPLSLMQYSLDEKERFKDLRAQKSLSTIPQSSEEARAYFRKEEFLRYSIPDRSFVYTAADGRKSIVAPLRRGGGKPTSKARDHFMLKRERPPHVTILCLVRDAASRLPSSIGTRADVCTLIRDSQYVVEDVTDAQVNQIVSGALDRLHYERDPCVQFDSERKLWVYLHRDREEEDFEDDGTSSTKKWKRPKKEAAEQTEKHEAVTLSLLGNQEQTGIVMGSDTKSVDELAGLQGAAEQGVTEEQQDDNAQGNGTTIWNSNNPTTTAVSKPVEDNTFFCQENSVDDDFNDET